MRRSVRLACACVLALALSLLTTPAAVAQDGLLQDTSADRSRAFKAYERDSGTLHKIKFTTTYLNAKRRVSAHLKVSMPANAADELLVATYQLICMPAGSNRGDNKILGSQNVLRGKTVTFNPHYLYTAESPGEHECWLRVSSGRPRPRDIRVWSNVFYVPTGSSLQLSSVQHNASQQGFTPREPSTVVRWHRTVDTASATVNVPLLANRISVSGDVWLTTCSSTGGSKDPVTGKLLCEGLINRSGTTVRTRVLVMQRKLFGDGYCRVTQFPDATGKLTYISKDVHHRMIYTTGLAPVSSDLSCSRSVTVKVRLQHVSGAAVIIHNQGTISTAIMPRG